MPKINIDQEIDALRQRIDERHDIDPDYLPKPLREFQNMVIRTHAQLEEALENLILRQIRIDERARMIGLRDDAFRLSINRTDLDLLSELSFFSKLNVVVRFGVGFPEDAARKINRYRIEFAHPRGKSLRDRYDISTSRGKQNVRDLLRCLAGVMEALDRYILATEHQAKVG